MSEDTLAIARRLTLLGNAMAYELTRLAQSLAESELHAKRHRELMDLLEAWEETLPQFRTEMEKLAKEKRR